MSYKLKTICPGDGEHHIKLENNIKKTIELFKDTWMYFKIDVRGTSAPLKLLL
jgi:hypothetical protein